MGHLSDQDYEGEKRRMTRYHDLLEIPVIIFLLIGIAMAALNVTLGGFTPIMWFVLSLWCVLVIICMEITMTRAALERHQPAETT